MQWEITKLAALITNLTTEIVRNETASTQSKSIALHTVSVIAQLINMSSMISMVASDIIQAKMKLNHRKYNETECRKRTDIFKWTEISQTTGVYESNQSILTDTNNTFTDHKTNCLLFFSTFKGNATIIRTFAENRGWINKYSMNSLALSLLAELGELSETMQWEDPKRKIKTLTRETLNKIAMEMADLFIYIMHLCREKNVTKEFVESNL